MLYYCREGQTYSLLPQAPKSRMSTTEENNSEVCCETLTQENGVNSWELAVYTANLDVCSHEPVQKKEAMSYTGVIV